MFFILAYPADFGNIAMLARPRNFGYNGEDGGMPHESIFIPSEKYARRAICSRRKRSPRPCVPRRRLSWRASCRPVRRSRCGRRRSTRTGQTRAAYPRFWRMMGWPINIWRRKRSRRQNCGSRRTACGCFPRFTVRCGRSTQSAPTGLSWRTGWMGAACTSSGAVRFTTICSVRVKRWSTSPQMNTARRCGAICRQATGW